MAWNISSLDHKVVSFGLLY